MGTNWEEWTVQITAMLWLYRRIEKHLRSCDKKGGAERIFKSKTGY